MLPFPPMKGLIEWLHTQHICSHNKGNPPNDDLGYTTIETTHPELTYRVPWDTY